MAEAPVPIVEQIALNIVTSLGVVIAGADYVNTITVKRVARKPASPADKLVAVMQADPLEDPDKMIPRSTHSGWLQPFVFACFVRESDKSTIAIDTRLNSIRTDVEKALMQDPRRGGLCWKDCWIAPSEYESDTTDGGIECVFVALVVPYMTLRNNPYRQK